MNDFGQRIEGLVRAELGLRLLLVVVACVAIGLLVGLKPPAEIAAAVGVVLVACAVAVSRSPVGAVAALLEKLR